MMTTATTVTGSSRRGVGAADDDHEEAVPQGATTRWEKVPKQHAFTTCADGRTEPLGYRWRRVLGGRPTDGAQDDGGRAPVHVSTLWRKSKKSKGTVIKLVDASNK